MYDISELSSLKRHWLLRTSNIPLRFIGLEPSDISERAGNFPTEVSQWIDDSLSGQVIRQVGNIGVNGVGLLFDGGPGIGNANFDYMVEVLSERGKHGTGFVEKGFERVLVGLSFFVLLVEIFGLGDDFILNSGQRSLGLASFFVLVILLVVKDAFVFLVAPGFF